MRCRISRHRSFKALAFAIFVALIPAPSGASPIVSETSLLPQGAEAQGARDSSTGSFPGLSTTPSSPAGCLTGNTRLRLKDAVECALANNPSISQQKKKVQEQAILKSKSASPLFPQVSFTGLALSKKDSVMLGDVFFDGDPYNQYTLDLHASQLLYQYGALSAVDVATKNERIQELQLEIAERDLTAQVIDAFYRLLMDQSNLDNLLGIEKAEQETLAVIVHRTRLGRNQYLDVLQAKTQLALIAPQIQVARTQVRVDAARIANLLGDPEAREVQIEGELVSPPLVALRSDLRLSEAHIPEYEQQLVRMERLDSQEAAALGPDLPQLSIVSDIGRNAYAKTDLMDSAATYWVAGLQLTIPLFSGLSSIYKRQDFASRASQLELQRNNVENNFSYAQVKSLKTVEVSYASLLPSIEAYRLASASLTEALRTFRLGTVDYLQYLTVQQAYYQAVTALNQAKYSYISSLVKYFVATGLPLNQLADDLQRG